MPQRAGRSPHDVEVPIPGGDRRAEHAPGDPDPALGRRAADRVLGAVAETAEDIVTRVSTVHKLLLLGIGAGAAVFSMLVWLGMRNEGPGARIDQLTQFVMRRDSLYQMQMRQLQMTVRQLGYTVCLSSNEGKAADGPTRCAERFLIIPADAAGVR